ncbi:MAG TPA: hypothetical protein VG860_13435 [Terriglobia bacterium]|nr:hypothetical protein [Terriglobia bacterium]
MLRSQFRSRLRTAAAALILLPACSYAQKPAKHGAGAPGKQTRTESTIEVSGQVTAPHGDPLAGAEVTIAVAGTAGKPQTLSSGLGGKFDVHVPGRPGPLAITVTAAMPGYTGAEDTVEAEAGQTISPVGLVLRKQPDDPVLPDLDDLCTRLLPGLRTPATGKPLTGVALRQMDVALRLLDRDAPESAAPTLGAIARQNSGCIECGTLAGLAELETGAWSSAGSNLMRAAHDVVTAGDKRRIPEPLIALGELQIWRGEFSKAAVSFLEALAIHPDQPLALQELGRAFLLQRRMTAADRYLGRALAHGGDAEGHLLRAQALIELNQPAKAQEQLDAYLGGRKAKDLAQGPRSLWSQYTARIALESGGGGATVIDRTPEELAAAMPDLKGLAPIADPAALDSVLLKVGRGVQAIFEGFPNTSVDEEIEMQRLHPDGKVADSLKQQFRYLLLSSLSRDSLVLNEFRTNNSGATVNPGAQDRDFMVTSGFASIPLIFHPTYQVGSSFRLLGRQQVAGHDALVIAFAERPATAKMLEDFVLKGQRAVVLTQGLAWVDADTFQVLRMHTDLLKPAPEVRLSSQVTDVSYGPVLFKSKNQTLWLPQDVAVTVSWNKRMYRNVHRYSNYQLFQVGTREKTKTPKPSSLPAEQ